MKARVVRWFPLAGAYALLVVGGRMRYGSWGIAFAVATAFMVGAWLLLKVPPEDKTKPY